MRSGKLLVCLTTFLKSNFCFPFSVWVHYLLLYFPGEILKLNPSYKTPPDYKPLLKEAIVPIPVSPMCILTFILCLTKSFFYINFTVERMKCTFANRKFPEYEVEYIWKSNYSVFSMWLRYSFIKLSWVLWKRKKTKKKKICVLVCLFTI